MKTRRVASDTDRHKENHDVTRAYDFVIRRTDRSYYDSLKIRMQLIDGVEDWLGEHGIITHKEYTHMVTLIESAYERE